jgi:hypothetical protein
VRINPWWLVLGAVVCFGIGWRARELFGPAIVRAVHHEQVETVGVDTTVVRYEFDPTTCRARRVK